MAIITVGRNDVNHVGPRPGPVERSRPADLCVPGGGIYESVVLDPVWPGRPAIIQAQHGGVSRRRFWIPVHGAVEVALIAAVIVTWGHPEVRTPMLIALASHAVVRVWSLIDLVPKVVAFQKANPAAVERAAAVCCACPSTSSRASRRSPRSWWRHEREWLARPQWRP
jgi:hypothetical protein